MKWIGVCFRKYADFSGRARRREFWYFYLFACVCNVAAMLLDSWFFGTAWPFSLDVGILNSPNLFFALIGPLRWTVMFVLLVPGLAVTVRRLHDTGKSTKLYLWTLVAYLLYIAIYIVMLSTLKEFMTEAGPFLLWGVLLTILMFGVALKVIVLGIFMLIWLCTPGDRGENKYGPDPKAVEES